MGKRILIIEDEREIQDILKELLMNAGYEATAASDGLEGIILFQKRKFDLILLDIMMPKIDGYGVCEIIRQESSIPIIVLTALDEEEAQIKAFELKADDYITKPFSVKLVLLRVEAVLRRVKERESQMPDNILTYGNVRLDRESHLVSVDGIPVSLTHTEYGLLERFMLHPGRVFTRDNLLNEVWGYDFIGDEKTVNIHIMNLRRKLGTDIIETIRGVGYRLGKEN